MFPIPHEFTLMGQKIRVNFCDNLLDEHECLGRSFLLNNLIELQSPNEEVSESMVYATWWHEFFHFAAFLTGYDKLNRNEQFIDLMSGCVVQLLTTANHIERDSHSDLE